MPAEPFVEGDKIALQKTANGWKIEMQVAKGGIIAPALAPVYPTAEAALQALSKQAETLQR